MLLKKHPLRAIINAARRVAKKPWPAITNAVCKVGRKSWTAVVNAVRKVLRKSWPVMTDAARRARKIWRKNAHGGRSNAPVEPFPACEADKRGKAASAKNKTVAVVPVYNHGETVGDVVATLRGYGLPVILVDDGSDTFTARALDSIVSMKTAFGPTVKLVRLPKNRGKGAAVMTGFRSAQAYGATHVLQVDADGQHGLEVVPRFLDASAQNPDAVIAGCPLYDATVPRMRFYGSRLCLMLVWVNTLSRRVVSPMCGFRLYPLARVKDILPAMTQARHMEFDTEIAVRLDWGNVPSVNLPVAVRYPLGGVSHFRIVRDNLRILIMHVRLFFGMLRRLPGLLSCYSGLLSRRFRPDGGADASPAIQKGDSTLGGGKALPGAGTPPETGKVPPEAGIARNQGKGARQARTTKTSARQ
jgi:glycosyltransferase involved in cell wall biosynthesis